MAVRLPLAIQQGVMRQREYNQMLYRRDPATQCGAPVAGLPDSMCVNPAGKGTNHFGTGKCWQHDGSRWHKAKGGSTNKIIRNFVEEQRMARTYGDPVDIDPHTALLMEVQRTAGHVEWLRELIDHVASQEPDNFGKALTAFTPLGIQPSVWIQLYQEERKHLVRVCQAAISAGVAERTVRLAQDQARMIAMIFKSFLLDNRLEMTPRQRLKAPEIIRELISGMSSDAVIIDADSTEEEQEPAPAGPTATKRSRSKKSQPE